MIDRPVSQKVKVLIILLLMAACFALTYFFHHVLDSGRVVTHFYYIPILLAAIWWCYRGLIVALIFALFLIFSSYLVRVGPISMNDYFRVCLFVSIAAIVALLSKKIEQAHRELYESETRYKTVFENMNLGVVILRVEDNGRRFIIKDLNRTAQTIEQLDNDQVIGKELLSVFPGAKDLGLCETIARVWQTGVAAYQGVRYYKDATREGWRENFVYRLPNDEVVAIYKDLTSQKQNEEKTQQLAAIVKSSNDAIIGMKMDGTITSWNQAAERIYGYTAEEVAGKVGLPMMPPAPHRQILKTLDMIAQNKRVKSFECQQIKKDGSLFDVSVTMSPILDINGQVMAASFVAHDISKRMKIEQALVSAHDHLEQQVEQRTVQLSVAIEELHAEVRHRKQVEEDLHKSNEQIKLFSYRVLHDLKSPTVSIHGLTKLLQNKYGNVLQEKGRQWCEQIIKGADQIASLVEKVNQFIATRESPLTLEELRVKELFQINSNEFAARLSERRIALLAEETEAVVRGDRLALIRVLRNFVENALKYGGESLSTIRLGYHSTADFHVLSVRDNGLGIRSENMQRIFGLFERGHPSSTIEGTGLGLAIVEEIAEQHHGSVWLESTPRVATTFYFSVAKDI